MSPTPQTPPTDRPLTAGDVPLLREGDVLKSVKTGQIGKFESADKTPDVFVWWSKDTYSPCHPLDGLTFVSRPATSAASEGEGDRRQAITTIIDANKYEAWTVDRAGQMADAILSVLSVPLSDEALERSVMVCPQCEGEGEYADGVDEAACSTPCTRCVGNGWLVDLAALASPPVSERERELEGALDLCSAALQRLHTDIEALMTDSEGVAGLHRNGEIAPWSDLQEGGSYADWLGEPLWAARNAWTDARRVLTAQPAGEGK